MEADELCLTLQRSRDAQETQMDPSPGVCWSRFFHEENKEL